MPGWRLHFGCHGHAEPLWIPGYSMPGQLRRTASTVLPVSLWWDSVQLPPWANTGHLPRVTCCGAIHRRVWGQTNAALLPPAQVSAAGLLRSPLAVCGCTSPVWGSRSAAPAKEPMRSCSRAGAAVGWDRMGQGWDGRGTGRGWGQGPRAGPVSLPAEPPRHCHVRGRSIISDGEGAATFRKCMKGSV